MIVEHDHSLKRYIMSEVLDFLLKNVLLNPFNKCKSTNPKYNALISAIVEFGLQVREHSLEDVLNCSFVHKFRNLKKLCFV